MPDAAAYGVSFVTAMEAGLYPEEMLRSLGTGEEAVSPTFRTTSTTESFVAVSVTNCGVDQFDAVNEIEAGETVTPAAAATATVTFPVGALGRATPTTFDVPFGIEMAPAVVPEMIKSSVFLKTARREIGIVPPQAPSYSTTSYCQAFNDGPYSVATIETFCPTQPTSEYPGSA